MGWEEVERSCCSAICSLSLVVVLDGQELSFTSIANKADTCIYVGPNAVRTRSREVSSTGFRLSMYQLVLATMAFMHVLLILHLLHLIVCLSATVALVVQT